MDKAIIKQIKKLNKKIKERFPNTFRGITPSFYAHQSSPLAEKKTGWEKGGPRGSR